ncbi:hypothetical protein QYE76_044216 [Lolium multiflorum]|uniref:Uncharacterized protein n=1 Tax=Lolium multiflorum TaxID=4521 RepID=A0AAD8TK85_LOLMU|nr:hypothetical protein QYE76_044216 [Lolium multiflorum]
MIPALQGLSSLQVSFGSVNDVHMQPADTILGKRMADEQEVQGERLELAIPWAQLWWPRKRQHPKEREDAGIEHGPIWATWCVPYTYDNKRQGRANVKVHLDRAVADCAWRELYADTHVQHLTSPVSDHCPVLVNILKEERTPTRQARRQYEIFWERDTALPERVAKAWEEVGCKRGLGDVMQGLNSVMDALQTWGKNKFGNILKELKKARAQLEILLRNNASQREVREATDHMNVLLYREEMLWVQRSRVTWLKEGDINTRFFHQKAVWRARKNKIKKLKDNDGTWKDAPTDMERMATSYFQELFTKDPSLNSDHLVSLVQNKVSMEMNEILGQDFTDEEIGDALFQIGPLKAPGVDGFQLGSTRGTGAL